MEGGTGRERKTEGTPVEIPMERWRGRERESQRQKLSSVFVIFPEHCSVTQSASGERMDVLCNMPQRPSRNLVRRTSADWLLYWSCGWRTPMSCCCPSTLDLVGGPVEVRERRKECTSFIEAQTQQSASMKILFVFMFEYPLLVHLARSPFIFRLEFDTFLLRFSLC